jgi:hypothetical protein
MPYMLFIIHLVVLECNALISLQRDGVADSLFECQQHQRDNDSTLHHLQEAQEPGRLVEKLGIRLHQ